MAGVCTVVRDAAMSGPMEIHAECPAIVRRGMAINSMTARDEAMSNEKSEFIALVESTLRSMHVVFEIACIELLKHERQSYKDAATAVALATADARDAEPCDDASAATEAMSATVIVPQAGMVVHFHPSADVDSPFFRRGESYAALITAVYSMDFVDIRVFPHLGREAVEFARVPFVQPGADVPDMSYCEAQRPM